MIKIIDYGMGNLRSVQKALERLGFKAQIISQAKELADAKGIILPGVGAFKDAISNLKKADFISPLQEAVARGVPLLAICLGMQLLMSFSEENGLNEGLGFIPGGVVRLPEKQVVPHMGWNQLEIVRNHRLVEGINLGNFVYFVHSYYVKPENDGYVVSRTEYGIKFPSIIAKNNIMGIQFHPEKSSTVGLKILSNYGEMVKGAVTTSN